LAILIRDRVSLLTMYPQHNVINNKHIDVKDFTGNMVDGYRGLYNFKHYFWITKHSRIYGPLPHLTLNIEQDLSQDLEYTNISANHLQLLVNIIDKPVTDFSLRIFSAIRWFNGSCRSTVDHYEAIVNLSIAFEALLALPHSEKTDRLVDSISLLLGRIPRLSDWARQFYDTRSRIVHDGTAHKLHFITQDGAVRSNKFEYQPFLTYGRQIFRLCIGTLLLGAGLAEQAGLEEKLVSNQERYEKICKIMGDETISAEDRIVSIADVVDALDRYRFISEKIISKLRLERFVEQQRRFWPAIRRYLPNKAYCFKN
jgi:Apea-like HEPN